MKSKNFFKTTLFAAATMSLAIVPVMADFTVGDGATETKAQNNSVGNLGTGSIGAGGTYIWQCGAWGGASINSLTGAGTLELKRTNNGGYDMMLDLTGENTNFTGIIKVYQTGTSTDNNGTQDATGVISNTLLNLKSENAAVNATVSLGALSTLLVGANNVKIAGLKSDASAGNYPSVFSCAATAPTAGRATNQFLQNDNIVRTLEITGSGDYTFAGIFGDKRDDRSAGLNLKMSGTGTQTLSGPVNAGNITVSAGSLSLAGTVASTNGISVTGTGKLIFSDSTKLDLTNWTSVETNGSIVYTIYSNNGGTVEGFNLISAEDIIGGAGTLNFNATSGTIILSLLKWAGADDTKLWNTTDSNWSTGKFSSGSKVVFDSTASSKIVNIAENISAGDIVVSDNYTFKQKAEAVSLSSSNNGISIADNKTLTILSGVENSTFTYTGSISGNGIFKVAAGTKVALTNVVLFSNFTAEETGTLELSTGTYTNAFGISGAGTLNLKGATTFNTNATQTNFTGTTNILSGTVTLGNNGGGATTIFKLGNVIDVNSGATLLLKLWTGGGNTTNLVTIDSTINLNGSTLKSDDGGYYLKGGIENTGTSTVRFQWNKYWRLAYISGEGTINLIAGTGGYSGGTKLILDSAEDKIFNGVINYTTDGAANASIDISGTSYSGAMLNITTRDRHLNLKSDVTLGGLTTVASSNVNLDTYTLTINNTAERGSSIAGAITGTGSLIKTGAGALNLSGTSNLTGDITIEEGTINVTGGSLTIAGTLASTGAVNVAGGELIFTNTTKIDLTNWASTEELGDQIYSIYTISGTGTVTGWEDIDRDDILGIIDLTKIKINDNGTITLAGGEIQKLIWNGNNGEWNATNTNWTKNGIASAYVDGELVEISGAHTITLGSVVAPGGVDITGEGTIVTLEGDGTNKITGTTQVFIRSGAELILNSAHDYTGNTNISGKLTLNPGNAPILVSNLMGGGTLNLNVATDYTLNLNSITTGTVANTLILQKSGLGDLTLGDTTFAGKINVVEGSLRGITAGYNNTITIGDGAKGYLAAGSYINANNFALAGNGTVYLATGTTTFGSRANTSGFTGVVEYLPEGTTTFTWGQGGTNAATAGQIKKFGDTIVVAAGQTMNLHLWTTSAVTTLATDKVIVDTNITLKDSTLNVNDGSYYFNRGLTVTGNSTFTCIYAKGFVFNGIQGNDLTSVFTLNRGPNDPADRVSVYSINGVSEYNGTIRLATNHAGAVSTLHLMHSEAAKNAIINLTDAAKTKLQVGVSSSIAGLRGEGTVGLADNVIFSINTAEGAELVASGIISGNGSLVIGGAGQQSLTGANTYTGTTEIQGGTLVADSTAIGAGDFIINGGIYQNRTETIFGRDILLGVTPGSTIRSGAVESLTLTGSIGLTEGTDSAVLAIGNGTEDTIANIVIDTADGKSIGQNVGFDVSAGSRLTFNNEMTLSSLNVGKTTAVAPATDDLIGEADFGANLTISSLNGAGNLIATTATVDAKRSLTIESGVFSGSIGANVDIEKTNADGVLNLADATIADVGTKITATAGTISNLALDKGTVTAAEGATFDALTISGVGVLEASKGTFNNLTINGGAIDFALNGNITSVNTTGTLSFGGSADNHYTFNLTRTIGKTPLTLFTYTNTDLISIDALLANLTITGVKTGESWTTVDEIKENLVFAMSEGKITVALSSNKVPLEWNIDNGNWDVVTGNWKKTNPDGSTTSGYKFTQGERVIFNANSLGDDKTSVVTLVSNIYSQYIEVNLGEAGVLTLEGANLVDGEADGLLVETGIIVSSGTLNLNMANNTYSGGTEVNSGATVNANAIGALGTGALVLNGTATANVVIGNTLNDEGNFTNAFNNEVRIGEGAEASLLWQNAGGISSEIILGNNSNLTLGDSLVNGLAIETPNAVVLSGAITGNGTLQLRNVDLTFRGENAQIGENVTLDIGGVSKLTFASDPNLGELPFSKTITKGSVVEGSTIEFNILTNLTVNADFSANKADWTLTGLAPATFANALSGSLTVIGEGNANTDFSVVFQKTLGDLKGDILITNAQVTFNVGISNRLNLTAGRVSGGQLQYVNENDMYGNVEIVATSQGAQSSVISANSLNIWNELSLNVSRGTAEKDLIISSIISEFPGSPGVSLIKAGNGVLELTGANTYTRGTNITAGSVIVSGAGSLGSGAISIADATSLTYQNKGEFTLGNKVTGLGGLNIGVINEATSTILKYDGDWTEFTGVVTVENNATLDLVKDLTIAGSLNWNGTLSGANDTMLRSANTTIGIGVTSLSAAEGNSWTFNPGTIGNISSATITKVGAGTTIISAGAGNSRDWSGATMIASEGTLTTAGNITVENITLSGGVIASENNSIWTVNNMLSATTTSSVSNVYLKGDSFINLRKQDEAAAGTYLAFGENVSGDNVTLRGDLFTINPNALKIEENVNFASLTVLSSNIVANIDIANGKTLSLGNAIISGAEINTGTAAELLSGSGTLSVSKKIDVKGTSNFGRGTLNLASENVEVAVNSGATLTLGGEAANSKAAVIISGGNTLTKTGSGTLTTILANTSNWKLDVQDGIVNISGLGSTASSVAVSGKNSILNVSETFSTNSLSLKDGANLKITATLPANRNINIVNGAFVGLSSTIDLSGATVNDPVGTFTLNASTMTVGDVKVLGNMTVSGTSDFVFSGENAYGLYVGGELNWSGTHVISLDNVGKIGANGYVLVEYAQGYPEQTIDLTGTTLADSIGANIKRGRSEFALENIVPADTQNGQIKISATGVVTWNGAQSWVENTATETGWVVSTADGTSSTYFQENDMVDFVFSGEYFSEELKNQIALNTEVNVSDVLFTGAQSNSKFKVIFGENGTISDMNREIVEGNETLMTNLRAFSDAKADAEGITDKEAYFENYLADYLKSSMTINSGEVTFVADSGEFLTNNTFSGGLNILSKGTLLISSKLDETHQLGAGVITISGKLGFNSLGNSVVYNDISLKGENAIIGTLAGTNVTFTKALSGDYLTIGRAENSVAGLVSVGTVNLQTNSQLERLKVNEGTVNFGSITDTDIQSGIKELVVEKDATVNFLSNDPFAKESAPLVVLNGGVLNFGDAGVVNLQKLLINEVSTITAGTFKVGGNNTDTSTIWRLAKEGVSMTTKGNLRFEGVEAGTGFEVSVASGSTLSIAGSISDNNLPFAFVKGGAGDFVVEQSSTISSEISLIGGGDLIFKDTSILAGDVRIEQGSSIVFDLTDAEKGTTSVIGSDGRNLVVTAGQIKIIGSKDLESTSMLDINSNIVDSGVIVFESLNGASINIKSQEISADNLYFKDGKYEISLSNATEVMLEKIYIGKDITWNINGDFSNTMTYVNDLGDTKNTNLEININAYINVQNNTDRIVFGDLNATQIDTGVIPEAVLFIDGAGTVAFSGDYNKDSKISVYLNTTETKLELLQVEGSADSLLERITGLGEIIKKGTGDLVLTSSSDFKGTLNLQDGNTWFNKDARIKNATITLGENAELLIAGTGYIGTADSNVTTGKIASKLNGIGNIFVTTLDKTGATQNENATIQFNGEKTLKDFSGNIWAKDGGTIILNNVLAVALNRDENAEQDAPKTAAKLVLGNNGIVRGAQDEVVKSIVYLDNTIENKVVTIESASTEKSALKITEINSFALDGVANPETKLILNGKGESLGNVISASIDDSNMTIEKVGSGIWTLSGNNNFGVNSVSIKNGVLNAEFSNSTNDGPKTIVNPLGSVVDLGDVDNLETPVTLLLTQSNTNLGDTGNDVGYTYNGLIRNVIKNNGDGTSTRFENATIEVRDAKFNLANIRDYVGSIKATQGGDLTISGATAVALPKIAYVLDESNAKITLKLSEVGAGEITLSGDTTLASIKSDPNSETNNSVFAIDFTSGQKLTIGHKVADNYEGALQFRNIDDIRSPDIAPAEVVVNSVGNLGLGKVIIGEMTQLTLDSANILNSEIVSAENVSVAQVYSTGVSFVNGSLSITTTIADGTLRVAGISNSGTSILPIIIEAGAAFETGWKWDATENKVVANNTDSIVRGVEIEVNDGSIISHNGTGKVIYAGDITIANGVELTLKGGGSGSILGVALNAGDIKKIENGTWILPNYSSNGSLTVEKGTLEISNITVSTFASKEISLGGSGSVLKIGSLKDVENITLNAKLTSLSGSQIYVVSGENSEVVLGDITNIAGTLTDNKTWNLRVGEKSTVTMTKSVSDLNKVILDSNSTLVFDIAENNTFEFSNEIEILANSSDRTIRKIGNGTLTFKSSNTLPANVDIENGTFELSSVSAGNAFATYFGNVNVAESAILNLGLVGESGTATIKKNITGTGNINVASGTTVFVYQKNVGFTGTTNLDNNSNLTFVDGAELGNINAGLSNINILSSTEDTLEYNLDGKLTVIEGASVALNINLGSKSDKVLVKGTEVFNSEDNTINVNHGILEVEGENINSLNFKVAGTENRFSARDFADASLRIFGGEIPDEATPLNINNSFAARFDAGSDLLLAGNFDLIGENIEIGANIKIETGVSNIQRGTQLILNGGSGAVVVNKGASLRLVEREPMVMDAIALADSSFVSNPEPQLTINGKFILEGEFLATVNTSDANTLTVVRANSVEIGETAIVKLTIDGLIKNPIVLLDSIDAPIAGNLTDVTFETSDGAKLDYRVKDNQLLVSGAFGIDLNGVPDNLKNLATIIQNGGAEDLTDEVYDYVYRQDGNTNDKLKALSPISFAALTEMSLGTLALEFDIARERFEQLCFERSVYEEIDTFKPYVNALGSTRKSDGSVDGANYDINHYGAVAGFDNVVSETLNLGLSVGYEISDAKLHNSAGKHEANTLRIGFYGLKMLTPATYLGFGLNAGFSAFDTKRNTGLDSLTGETSGESIGATINVGHAIVLDSQREWKLIPKASIDFAYAGVDSIREMNKNATSALEVDGFEQTSLQAKLATTLSYQPIDSDVRFGLTFAIAQEMLDTDKDIDAQFANGVLKGKSFTSTAELQGATRIQVSPSMVWQLDKNSSITLGYTYSSDLEDVSSHTVNAGYRVRF